jgi:hypothetical protein
MEGKRVQSIAKTGRSSMAIIECDANVINVGNASFARSSFHGRSVL